MAVSIDDLLAIIGSKEAEIFALRRENNKLRNEVFKLQPPAPAPAPEVRSNSNVIPFPGRSDV